MSVDILAVERNFLGCLLRSPHDYWSVNDMVTADMFSVAFHQKIFEAVRYLSEAGRNVTFSALQAHLPAEDDDGAPYVGHLATLRENAADAGGAQDYASAISDRSAANRIATLGEWMAKQIKSGKNSPEEVSAEAVLQLQEIMSVASPVRPRPIGEAATDLARLVSEPKNGELVHGLNTGIASLDEILGLMLAGDLGAIIASQGDGKSALAAQIGMHAAAAGRPVLLIQLEMSSEQVAARELAAASGLSVAQIHAGAFDAFQHEKVSDAERALRTVPFHILDVDEATVRQIEAQARTMQRNTGLSLLVIDQLDKIKGHGKYRDRFERGAEVTRDLKKMAKRLKVPVIILAQRTRGAQRRDDPTPDILDADFPSLERDVDWCLGLYQRANWMRRNMPDPRRTEDFDNWKMKIQKAEGQAAIIVLKRRRGKAFEECQLQFRGSIMRFEEIS